MFSTFCAIFSAVFTKGLSGPLYPEKTCAFKQAAIPSFTSRHSVVHKPPRQIRFTFFPSGFALKAPFPNVAAESTANGFQRLQNPAPPYPVKKSGRGVFLCGNNPPLSATKTRQKSSSDRLYIPIRRTDTLFSLNPRLSDKTPSAAQRFLCGCRRSTFPSPPSFQNEVYHIFRFVLYSRSPPTCKTTLF